MIVDSSALVAIALQEPGYERIEAALAAAHTTGIGAPTLVETTIVLSARLRRDARGLASRLLRAGSIDVIPFTDPHYDVAVSAWLRFGKGRHAADLNFGDCLSYATALVAGRPLLCVGDAFPKTDLPLALPPIGE